MPAFPFFIIGKILLLNHATIAWFSLYKKVGANLLRLLFAVCDFVVPALYGNNAENTASKNHKYEVKKPDYVPAEYNTKNSRNDFTIGKSCYKTADKRCNRNYSKDYADKTAKPEIIAPSSSFCHYSANSLSFYFLYYTTKHIKVNKKICAINQKCACCAVALYYYIK